MPFTEMEKTIGGDSLQEEIRRSRVESELSIRHARGGVGEVVGYLSLQFKVRGPE